MHCKYKCLCKNWEDCNSLHWGNQSVVDCFRLLPTTFCKILWFYLLQRFHLWLLYTCHAASTVSRFLLVFTAVYNRSYCASSHLWWLFFVSYMFTVSRFFHSASAFTLAFVFPGEIQMYSTCDCRMPLVVPLHLISRFLYTCTCIEYGWLLYRQILSDDYDCYNVFSMGHCYAQLMMAFYAETFFHCQ